MKPITSTEAHEKLHNIYQAFLIMEEGKVSRMSAVIENISFADFIALDRTIQFKDKRFYLPGEMDNECMTILLQVAPGAVIALESEPCLKYKSKPLQKFNLN